MNCEIYQDTIEDLLDGELAAPDAARLNSHIFACAGCAARLESLKQEREIYRHFLFTAEPPNDLWTKFAEKLENEKVPPNHSALPKGAPFWKISLFNLQDLSAAPMITAALVVFSIGLGIVYFWSNQKAAENQDLAQTEIRNVAAEVGETEVSDSFLPAQKGGNKINTPQAVENKINRKLFVAKSIVGDFGSVAAKEKIGKKQIFLRRENNLPMKNFRLNEQSRALALKNLEMETARQLEKIELLLRTFRNVRSGEAGSEWFDVTYEKRQARKLLEKNARLRQSGETYGMADETELLSRVEPYLLEIANLDEKSAPGKISDIKERVANQNIIASLQIY